MGDVSLAANQGVEVVGTSTFEVAAGKTLTIAGIIINHGDNIGRLTKAGDGMLVLSGANTYTGLTLVQVGTLKVRHEQALGTTDGATRVEADAILELGSNINIIEGHSLRAIAEALTLAGTLKSTRTSNSFDGTITVEGTTATIENSAGNFFVSGAVGGTDLVITGSGNTVFNGAIKLSGDLVISGTVRTGFKKLEVGKGLRQEAGAGEVTFNGNVDVKGDVALLGDTRFGSLGDVTFKSAGKITLGNVDGSSKATLQEVVTFEAAKDLEIRAVITSGYDLTLRSTTGDLHIRNDVAAGSVKLEAKQGGVFVYAPKAGAVSQDVDVTAKTGNLEVETGVKGLTLKDATGSDRRARMITQGKDADILLVFKDKDDNPLNDKLFIETNDGTNAKQIVAAGGDEKIQINGSVIDTTKVNLAGIAPVAPKKEEEVKPDLDVAGEDKEEEVPDEAKPDAKAGLKLERTALITSINLFIESPYVDTDKRTDINRKLDLIKTEEGLTQPALTDLDTLVTEAKDEVTRKRDRKDVLDGFITTLAESSFVDSGKLYAINNKKGEIDGKRGAGEVTDALLDELFYLVTTEQGSVKDQKKVLTNIDEDISVLEGESESLVDTTKLGEITDKRAEIKTAMDNNDPGNVLLDELFNLVTTEQRRILASPSQSEIKILEGNDHVDSDALEKAKAELQKVLSGESSDTTELERLVTDLKNKIEDKRSAAERDEPDPDVPVVDLKAELKKERDQLGPLINALGNDADVDAGKLDAINKEFDAIRTEANLTKLRVDALRGLITAEQESIQTKQSERETRFRDIVEATTAFASDAYVTAAALQAINAKRLQIEGRVGGIGGMTEADVNEFFGLVDAQTKRVEDRDKRLEDLKPGIAGVENNPYVTAADRKKIKDDLKRITSPAALGALEQLVDAQSKKVIKADGLLNLEAVEAAIKLLKDNSLVDKDLLEELEDKSALIDSPESFAAARDDLVKRILDLDIMVQAKFSTDNVKLAEQVEGLKRVLAIFGGNTDVDPAIIKQFVEFQGDASEARVGELNKLLKENVSKVLAAVANNRLVDVAVLKAKLGKDEVTPADLADVIKQLAVQTRRADVAQKEAASAHNRVSDVILPKPEVLLSRPEVRQRTLPREVILIAEEDDDDATDLEARIKAYNKVLRELSR